MILVSSYKIVGDCVCFENLIKYVCTFIFFIGMFSLYIYIELNFLVLM